MVRGFTQQELAEKAGLAVTAVCNYEAGTRMPRLDSAARIADALDVSLDALVEGENAALACILRKEG